MSAPRDGRQPVAEQQAHVQRAESGEREPVTIVYDDDSGQVVEIRTAHGVPLVLEPGDVVVNSTSTGMP